MDDNEQNLQILGAFLTPLVHPRISLPLEKDHVIEFIALLKISFAFRRSLQAKMCNKQKDLPGF